MMMWGPGENPYTAPSIHKLELPLPEHSVPKSHSCLAQIHSCLTQNFNEVSVHTGQKLHDLLILHARTLIKLAQQ